MTDDPEDDYMRDVVSELTEQLEELLDDQPEYVQYAILMGAVAKHVIEHYDDYAGRKKTLDGFCEHVRAMTEQLARAQDIHKRVTKILLDKTITDDERQVALVPLMKEHMKHFEDPDFGMACWADMIVDIAKEHNLGHREH